MSRRPGMSLELFEPPDAEELSAAPARRPVMSLDMFEPPDAEELSAPPDAEKPPDAEEPSELPSAMDSREHAFSRSPSGVSPVLFAMFMPLAGSQEQIDAPAPPSPPPQPQWDCGDAEAATPVAKHRGLDTNFDVAPPSVAERNALLRPVAGGEKNRLRGRWARERRSNTSKRRDATLVETSMSFARWYAR